jgi:DNA-directed RNA polymerase specialized sigma24 family protein
MVTWQGSAPRWRSPARARSPERAGSPASEQSDRSEQETLRDADGLVDKAEAALDPAGKDGPETDGLVDEVEAKRLRAERLRADQMLVEAVLEQGIGGSRHRALEDALIRYAVPVLKHVLSDGQIVSKATKFGRPPVPPDAWLDFTDDERQEFAHEMVANALPVFTKAVFEERRWTPRRGASLKTYFVNACILQFARLQEQWLNHRRAVRPTGLEIDPDAFAPVPDLAVTVSIQDEVSRLLSKVPDEKLREVLVLRGAGWNAEDAAQQAGLTPKAAEGRLARFRRGLKEERAGTEQQAGKRADAAQGGR